MLNVFGRQKHSVNNFNTDIFFSIETKAYAYILMALKLCFGLDGVREFNDNDNTDSTINVTFNVMQWLFQLKMRMMFWEGYDPADILQTHKPVQPLYYEKNFIHGKVSKGGLKLSNPTPMLEVSLSNVAPDILSASIPNPFPEYTCGVHTYGNDDDALYAPLRYQETVLSKFLSLPRTAEEKQEIRMSTDEYAIRTFKADFNNYILITESSFPTNRRTFSKEGGICFSDVNRARNWSSYFPCAERYVRYPRPIFTSGGILRMKEAEVDSSSHGASMKHSTASSLQMLFASRKSAIDAWESAKSSMSSTFTMLVHFFSKIIGESEHVLYGAFMMLEFQIVDHKRFNELKKAMVDGKSYPLRTTRAYKENERSYGTFDVSAANNISDASEIDVVRLEVSKECGNSSDNPKNIDFDTMDSEYSSYSDSDSDFATTDSSSDNTTKVSKKRSSNSSSKRTGSYLYVADRRTSLHQRKINKTQRHCRAYEFDIIWMLVAMRYW
ncbi:hypothetical protein DICVIV_01416 [Dictyocaulus viviparus]|uniref:Uncharacterized protein n=1 Tax=Dictyocaulus viviparus TaxID=29172 RepID=A0A0D8Y8X4_DICVI|nr:hypothetical protein DICVIV_01416 [Dictyocaulus viviparus]